MGGSIRFGAVLVSFTLALHAGVARAADPGQPQPTDPVLGPYRRPPPEPTSGEALVPRYRWDTGHRLHDGFYFRMAGGIGLAFDRMYGPGSRLQLPKSDGTRGNMGGFAIATEMALGTAVWDGLVLGLVCDTALMPSPSANAAADVADYRFEASQLALFGPLADYYIIQDKGFHAQAAVGLSVLVAGLGSSESGGKYAQPHTAVGPGFSLGVGYEWWVADEWGLGLLGRVLYGWMNGRDPVGVDWTHKAGAVTILMSATYQ